MAMKRKLGSKILMAVLCALLIPLSVIGCAPAPTPTTKGTIVFADVGWDSVQVHNRIAGFIVEHGYGYKIEMVPGETIALFEGLARGDVDINMECWVENQQEAYNKHIAAGDVVDLGSNFPDSWQGWLVPTFMIENGDLPEAVSVNDMSKYWELFKDPEDPTKGRFVNSIPGWLCTAINSQKLEVYGLDEYYTDFLAGSDAALSGSMVAAYQKDEPWFGYYWEPTWVLGKLDMTPIEEPPFDQAEWDAKTYGCAFPPTHVNIIVNSSLIDSAPDIVAFLKKYGTTCEQNNKVLAYMQDNKASTEDAALWFLKEYDSLWAEWVPSDVASKVKAALP